MVPSLQAFMEQWESAEHSLADGELAMLRNIEKKDRGGVFYWLLNIATEAQRRHFARLVCGMHRSLGEEEATTTERTGESQSVVGEGVDEAKIDGAAELCSIAVDSIGGGVTQPPFVNPLNSTRPNPALSDVDGSWSDLGWRPVIDRSQSDVAGRELEVPCEAERPTNGRAADGEVMAGSPKTRESASSERDSGMSHLEQDSGMDGKQPTVECGGCQRGSLSRSLLQNSPWASSSHTSHVLNILFMATY